MFFSELPEGGIIMELFLQYIVAGVTYGTIYAIVAIGFNIIYNTTGIINFAQGEFVMLGGMTAFTLKEYMPLPLAIISAVVITMIVGALIEIVFIRWLHKPSVLRMIIITIGLSILIRETALHIWGEGVTALPYFTGTSSDFGQSWRCFHFTPGVLGGRNKFSGGTAPGHFLQLYPSWQTDACLLGES